MSQSKRDSGLDAKESDSTQDGDGPSASQLRLDSDERAVTAAVRAKAALMARARNAPSTFWRSLAHIGVLGWLFVLPLVAFALLGHYIAGRFSQPAFGIGGLLLGLVISIYVTGRAVMRAIQEVGQDRTTQGDEDEQ